MDKLKEYLDYIIEFCQDHMAAMIAGAVVLVILLFCLVLVRTAQRQDQEEEGAEDKATGNEVPEEVISEEVISEASIPEESIPEESVPEESIPEESTPEANVSEESVTEEVSFEDGKTLPQEQSEIESLLTLEQALAAMPEWEVDQEPEPLMANPDTAATDEPREAQTDAPSRPEVTKETAASELETEIARTIGGEKLTALPAKFSTQNLRSVEIHIEKAHITFHYASPEEEATSSGSEIKAESEAESGPRDCNAAAHDQCAAGDTAECNRTVGEDTECEARMDFLDTEECLADEKPQIAKKYGAENRNVSRSGREYTVEELYVKIRD